MKYLIFLLLIQNLSAVNFRIDYSFDTNGFFGDPNDPNDGRKERRDAIEAVAALFSELIQDEFLEINASTFVSSFPGRTWTPRFSNPSTGNIQELAINTVIPENEVIVYVGARDLGGNVLGRAGSGFLSASGTTPWLEHVQGRGQANAGAFDGSNTDIAIWGGSIAFDSDDPNDSARTWNFSLSENEPGQEFVGVAIHEFCHVLGIGSADSWDNLIDANNNFLGPVTFRSLGSFLAIDGDGSHFSDAISDSLSFGSFDVEHGIVQPASMRPSISDNGVKFNVISDLDLAALIDIGWEVRVPAAIEPLTFQSSLATLTWPTSSFVNYQISRASNLTDFTEIGVEINGDGSRMMWSDASTPTDKAFYRIEETPVFPATGGGAQEASFSFFSFIDSFEEEIIEYESPVIEPIACTKCDHCNE